MLKDMMKRMLVIGCGYMICTLLMWKRFMERGELWKILLVEIIILAIMFGVNSIINGNNAIAFIALFVVMNFAIFFVAKIIQETIYYGTILKLSLLLSGTDYLGKMIQKFLIMHQIEE